MAGNICKKGILSGRLNAGDYIDNFADLYPLFDSHEAKIEAEKCLFCNDAPCQIACPAEIDIPLFIRQIAMDNPLGAAKTIFEQNIFGAMCARVCPVEILCEEACVRQKDIKQPVKIGRLQRYANDLAIEENKQFFKSGKKTGKIIAIIGAGPAGLSCAHRLAMLGHEVEIFEAKEKPGGLNEYGIAPYKAPNDFAQKEIDYILQIGNIKINYNQKLGRDFTLDELEEKYDAIFLGIGLGATNRLNIKGEESEGVEDAIDFIAKLRQAKDKSQIAIGRDVIVIGGGMSAIDVAIEAKLLGAKNVTICYRRGKEHMGASEYEQELAVSKGVIIKHWLSPQKIKSKNGRVKKIKFSHTKIENGALKTTDNIVTFRADQIFKAIGQNLIMDALEGLELKSSRILVDDEFRTSRKKIFAGGDAILGGEDLTVSAVANGRDAAMAIDRQIMGKAREKGVE